MGQQWLLNPDFLVINFSFHSKSICFFPCTVLCCGWNACCHGDTPTLPFSRASMGCGTFLHPRLRLFISGQHSSCSFLSSSRARDANYWAP